MLFAVEAKWEGLGAVREVKRACQPVPDRKRAAEVHLEMIRDSQCFIRSRGS